MSTSESTLPENIVRQAIAWQIRLESEQAADSDRLACECWRQSDPQHELAWQRLQRMNATFEQVASKAPSLAKPALLQTDVDCRRMGRRQAMRTLGGTAFSVAALALLADQQGLYQRLQADYSRGADAGQYRLSDNSQLWLNSHSAVELDFNRRQRALLLSRGEMHLVSSDDPRPLQVRSNGQLFSADNARFTLRHQGDQSLLHVVQGNVLIESEQADVLGQAHAGQALLVNQQRVSELDTRRFDYSSWVDGLLAVRAMPLGDLLQELRRYRSGVLRCHPSLQQHPVSGVFQLQDSDLILQTLARSAGAEVVYRTRWWAQIEPVGNA